MPELDHIKFLLNIQDPTDDAVTHEILDVVKARHLQTLMQCFFKFHHQIRLKVKFITIDSYELYLLLIKKLFS
ncbi:transposase [Lactovum miscens]|uniref:Transposase n=1 Tax=Lactovum miscens TaxID=190387 RepID=A0A841CA22_9LACT|nr:transposase [Lactovum miscens]